MSGPGDGRRDCFVCRLMRSFGVTGLGAALGGFGTLALGGARSSALWAALIGGLITAGLYLRGGPGRG